MTGGPPRRWGRALAALLACLVTLVTAPALPSVATESDPGEDRDATGTSAPLEVGIRSLTPAVVPRKGSVTLTGTITNRSDSTWTDLNVYLFMSADPIRSSGGLATATATEETLEVGARITAPGLYDEVPDLAPGESTAYLLSVPRSALPARRQGVYWVGAHVLGSDERGRIEGADGRARTFIPLLDADEPLTTLSLVLPVKGRVLRNRDGRLGNPAGWHRLLEDEGRLSRLLELSRSSEDVPLSWMVDPAVLDAASSLAAGDPAFDLGPTDDREGAGAPPSATPSPPEDEKDPGDDDPARSEGAARAARAADWLADFVAQTEQHEVLTVPYGDLDVASVLRQGNGDLYDRAVQLSARALEVLGVRGTPVVAPPDGRLPNDALDGLDSSATLLLDEGVVDTEDRLVRLRQGHLVVRVSPAAHVGGPGPTPPFDALALRQRILAEAAVHALTGGAQQPLVVTLPESWDPGEHWRSSAFFAALDQPWLRTVNLPFAVALATPGAYDGDLAYARPLRREELPADNLRATEELDEAGRVLAELLTRNDTVDDQVGTAAMLASSFHARTHPAREATRGLQIAGAVREHLGAVRVESSPLVTMSSETGSFSVTVVNGIDQPVTVGITVETGTDELEIGSPDLVSLGPGQRASVRLAVTATDTGVHSVSIMPTTRDGRPLGAGTRVKVRSSQVGLVVWFIMGTGALVFVAAIALRVVRRVRARKATHGPLLKGEGS